MWLSKKHKRNAAINRQQEEPIEMLDDVDDESRLADLSRQELIGTAGFFMHQLMGAPQRTLTLTLAHPKRAKNGTVTLAAEQRQGRLSADVAIFTVEGLSVNRKGTLFFRLLRPKDGSDSDFVPVYQSEGAKGVRNNFKWVPVRAGTAGLMRDDPTWPLRLELFEYRGSGAHQLLGTEQFKFSELIDRTRKWEGPFGTVMIRNAEIQKRASFLDYLFGGVNIALTIAIDFTASNGSPADPNSLHYFDLKSNQYLQAIAAVGQILQEYDSDKNIPVFGFGAKLPNLDVSHCFALNGNIFAPELHTIEGVIQAYRANLSKLNFCGPTNFAEIIRYVGDSAYHFVSHGNAYNYNVLLILTDGQITDFDETVDEIVRCSTLPVSIIIVGVGGSDFSQMDRLDADTQPLFSRRLNRQMLRDIVQFVPFNQYRSNPAELARQTLAELPKQLVDYMTQLKVPPLSPNAPVPAAPPSFYETRKQNFLAALPPTANPSNAMGLLQAGFPCENHQIFLRALISPYTNVLHV